MTIEQYLRNLESELFKIKSEEVQAIIKEIKKTEKVNKAQYRAITGACQYGTNKFCEEHSITVDEIELSELKKILIDEWGKKVLGIDRKIVRKRGISMNKFKVGQRVKIIRTGKEGKITVVDDDDFSEDGWTNRCYQVALEGREVYWFTVHDLELIKEILDEIEKKYLNNVINPFREKVTFIKKDCYRLKEFIRIGIKNDAEITLPFFLTGTMYKGMKIYKQYTLSELGLED